LGRERRARPARLPLAAQASGREGRRARRGARRERNQATDLAVAPGETITYRLVALDADDLRSVPSDPVEIVGIAYDPSAEATSGGVRVAWNPTAQAGFRETRIYRNGEEVGRSASASYLDTAGKPGDRYALLGVRLDGSEAPRSREVEAK
jgi:hypothetical protein